MRPDPRLLLHPFRIAASPGLSAWEIHPSMGRESPASVRDHPAVDWAPGERRRARKEHLPILNPPGGGKLLVGYVAKDPGIVGAVAPQNGVEEIGVTKTRYSARESIGRPQCP